MKSDLVARWNFWGTLAIRQNPTWPPRQKANNNFFNNKARIMRNTIFSYKSDIMNSFDIMYVIPGQSQGQMSHLC